MSVNDPNAVLEAIKASLQAKLPDRVVTRDLPADPALLPLEDLRRGVLCLVGAGGGDFANYMGREGDLGTLRPSIAGFVIVDEGTPTSAIEVAEYALLLDVLNWTNDQGALPVGAVLPVEFAQSKQLEHPFGWVVLSLDLKP